MLNVDISQRQSILANPQSTDSTTNASAVAVADKTKQMQEDEYIAGHTVLLDSVLRLTNLCEQHQLPRLRDLDLTGLLYIDQMYRRSCRWSASEVDPTIKLGKFSYAIATLIARAAPTLTSFSLPALCGLYACMQDHSFTFRSGLNRLRLQSVGSFCCSCSDKYAELFVNLLLTVLDKCESPRTTLAELALENVDMQRLELLPERRRLKEVFENAEKLHKLTLTLERSVRVEDHPTVTKALSMFKHVRTLSLTSPPCGPLARSLCPPDAEYGADDANHNADDATQGRKMPKLTAIEYTPYFTPLSRDSNDGLSSWDILLNFNFLRNTIQAFGRILTKFHFSGCVTDSDSDEDGDCYMKPLSLAVNYEQYLRSALPDWVSSFKEPFNVGTLVGHCYQLRELSMTVSADCMMSDMASLLNDNCMTLTYLSITIIPSPFAEMQSSTTVLSAEVSMEVDVDQSHDVHDVDVDNGSYWNGLQFNAKEDWCELATAIAGLSQLNRLIIDDGSGPSCPSTETERSTDPSSHINDDEGGDGDNSNDTQPSTPTSSLEFNPRTRTRSCFRLPLSMSDKQGVLEGLRIIIHGIGDTARTLRVTVALDLQPSFIEVSSAYAGVLEAMLEIGNRCTLRELSVALFGQNYRLPWQTGSSCGSGTERDSVESLTERAWRECESLHILRFGGDARYQG